MVEVELMLFIVVYYVFYYWDVFNHMIFSGAYVPLLTEGRIMVDGVLASCYADFHHDLAHLTVAPMQKFPALMGWLFGEDIGYPVYVSTLRKLGMMMLLDEQFRSYYRL